jgi:hypothetical protein
MDILTFLESLGEQRIGAAASFVGHHVIGGLEIHGVHIAGLHELEDLHGLGGLGFDLLDFVRFDDDVLVLAKLVTFDDFAALDHLVFQGTDILLLDPLVVGPVEHVKGDTAATRAGEQAHRHGNQAKGQISRPNGSRHNVSPRTEKGARAAPSVESVAHDQDFDAGTCGR